MAKTKETRPETAATVQSAHVQKNHLNDTPAGTSRQAPIPPNIAELVRRISSRPDSAKVMEVLRRMAQLSPKQLAVFIEMAEEIRAAREEGRA